MNTVDSRAPAHSKPNRSDRRRARVHLGLSPESESSKKEPSRKCKGGWYTIRDIVAEKVEHGRVLYLIDWDGTDRNGRRYNPSWEPAVNVTSLALRDWGEVKRRKVSQFTNAPSRRTSSPPPLRQESKPVHVQAHECRYRQRKSKGKSNHRYSKRGRTETLANTEEGFNKRRKTDGPILPSHCQVPQTDSSHHSISSSIHGDIGISKFDSNTEVRPVVKNEGAHLVVELTGVSSAFDPSEFRIIPPSQASQASPQLTQLERLRPSGTVENDCRVIPDSQELSSISTLRTGTRHHSPADCFVESQFSYDPSVRRGTLQSSSSRSSPDIPSHQPDPHFTDFSGISINTNSFTNSVFSIVTNPKQGQLHPTVTIPSQGPVNESVVFQTQIGPDPSDQFIATSSLTASHGSTVPASFPQLLGAETSQEKQSQNPLITDRDFTTTRSHFVQFTQYSYSSSSNATSRSRFELISDEDRAVSNTSRWQKEDTAARRHLGQIPRELHNYARTIPTASFGGYKTGAFATAHEEPRLAAQESREPEQACIAGDSLQYSRPVTPTPICNMDGTNSTNSPLSAKERLRRFREGHFNKPPATGPASTVTSSQAPLDNVSHVAHNPSPQVETHADSRNASTVDASALMVTPTLLQASEALQMQVEPSYPETAKAVIDPEAAQSPMLADTASMVSYRTPQVEQLATLDPSTLTLSIENDVADSPSVATDDGFDSGPPVPRSTDSAEEVHARYSGSFQTQVPTGRCEYLITLPFQTSSRGQYNDIIRENEALMIEYNASFRVVPHETPRKSLVEKLDVMFSRLFDMCDFPPFLDSLPPMSPLSTTKHSVGTNAKFAFVEDLLDDLQSLDSEKKVLILVRPGKLMDLLGYLIQSRNCGYIRSGQEIVSAADAEHPLTVALSSTSDEKSSIPKDSDVVIAFDYTFRQELVAKTDESSSPIILALVNIASIQHLNMCITEDLQPLERKMVLTLALVNAMRFVEDPDPTASISSIAEKFARRIQTPEDDDDDFYWEPQQLPTEIFDDLRVTSSQILASQSGAEGHISQKRSHMDDDGNESPSKRPKMSQPPIISSLNHISDAFRQLLGDDLMQDSENGTVTMPLDKLQALAGRFSEVESKLEESQSRANDFRELSDRIQKENQSYISSIQNIQTKYMDALKERSVFEVECKVAQEQASVLGNSLDSCRSEIATLKAAQAELEKKLSEAHEALANTSNPDLVKLAELEKNLTASTKQVQRLEKRLVVAQSDIDYNKLRFDSSLQQIRELTATNRASEKKLEELNHQASANVVEVNKIQSQNAVRALAQQVKEQKSIVRDREAELSRIKEELKTLKNGRRETRQSSVPRSPRPYSLGVMSPRNGRVPSAMGGPSSSRGTSPQPPLSASDASPGGNGSNNGAQNSTLFNQGSVANRFAHLRDQRF